MNERIGKNGIIKEECFLQKSDCLFKSVLISSESVDNLGERNGIIIKRF